MENQNYSLFQEVASYHSITREKNNRTASWSLCTSQLLKVSLFFPFSVFLQLTSLLWIRSAACLDFWYFLLTGLIASQKNPSFSLSQCS